MAGLGKYFNSETNSGRANVAKATYASFALLYLYFRVRRGSKKQEIEESNGEMIPACPCNPCQPACSPQNTCPTPPLAEDPNRSLKDDPLFKHQQQKKSAGNECEDDDD